MPSYSRGKKREDLFFVAVNDTIYYGWKRKDLGSLAGVSGTDLTATLGHTAQNQVPAGKILVIGAQSPKPPTVRKKIANATVGQQQYAATFCANNKLAAAMADGWNLSKNRRSVTLRAKSELRGSLTAIASLSDNSLYCFPMNKQDFEDYAAELGLESAATISNTEANRLVAGSNKPRPGRASKLLSSGSSFSSFYSTGVLANVVENGYDILSEEIVLTPASSGGGN